MRDRDNVSILHFYQSLWSVDHFVCVCTFLWHFPYVALFENSIIWFVEPINLVMIEITHYTNWHITHIVFYTIAKEIWQKKIRDRQNSIVHRFIFLYVALDNKPTNSMTFQTYVKMLLTMSLFRKKNLMKNELWPYSRPNCLSQISVDVVFILFSENREHWHNNLKTYTYFLKGNNQEYHFLDLLTDQYIIGCAV